MLEKFRREPFHNLYLLFGYPQTTLALGGTCSDKALSFYQAVRRLGVSASLHSAFIGGREIHRLVKVESGGRSYLADVGNGWPAVELYPLDMETSYTCFGMRFRSVIEGRVMHVYNKRNGIERHQMVVPLQSKPEAEIRADIKKRFNSDISYPFSQALRFSQVMGERFLFLRDDRLEIYSDKEPYQEKPGIKQEDLREVLHRYFTFNLDRLARGEAGETR